MKFNPDSETVPDMPLDIGHMAGVSAVTGQARGAAAPIFSAVGGKPRVIMTVGAGGAGKTLLMRWIGEAALGRGDTLGLVTVDPGNRELLRYFIDGTTGKTLVMSPAGDPVLYLERLLRHVMDTATSVAIDFGGGDTALGRLIGQTPGLTSMLCDAGVTPVLLYLLTPRVVDLTVPLALETAGFQPTVTALVLNDGTIRGANLSGDPDSDAALAFAAVRRHAAYKAMLARGAVELRMPRLYAAEAIELRRMSFMDAASTNNIDRFMASKTFRWLQQMETVFGWL